MEESKGKSYKLWQMIAVFLVGGALAAGAFMMPATGGQGFILKEKVADGDKPNIENPFSNGDQPPTIIAGECAMTTCDLSNTIVSMWHTVTGQLGAQTEQFGWRFNESYSNQETLIGWMHPTTGDLAKRLDKIETKLDKILQNL